VLFFITYCSQILNFVVYNVWIQFEFNYQSPEIQQRLQNVRKFCRRPASATKASCKDKSIGSLHACDRNLTARNTLGRHAMQINGQWPYTCQPYWTWMGRDKTGEQDSFLSLINLRNSRETYSTLQIIFHKAFYWVMWTLWWVDSTHAFRCCEFSVVGYLYVDAVCMKMNYVKTFCFVW
jgi:hypothetical protein